MEALRKCLNPKVLAIIATVIVAIAVFAPKALAAAPLLLLLAICPISMVLMMVFMSKHSETDIQTKDNKEEPKND